MNYGYQNEFDFVNLFNDKYINELDDNTQSFLCELFDNNILNDEKIKAWKNKVNQKTDIFIKYKNRIKGISLKCGNSNSIHQETIETFKVFLENLNIPYKIIDNYVSYHYGYDRNDDGKIDFTKSLTSEEYKKIHQDEINLFNNKINNSKIMVEMIDRFIIRGRNSNYDIDALISGTVSNYVWILKYDIYDLIISKRFLEYTSPHIGCITIGPKKRNIDRQSKNSRERYIVCCRWNFITEDILNYRKQRSMKKW